MTKSRVTPEPGTLVEYISKDWTTARLYPIRFQVYLRDDRTYVCEKTCDLSSDAFAEARLWMRRGHTVKVYDAVACKWLAVPR